MRKLTDEQIVLVGLRYQAGESSDVIAEDLGVSGRSIRGLLARRGIGRRTQSEAQRRHAIDQSFFKDIDSESKAYWLGFLLADVTISGTTISLWLHRKDAGHLAKFRSAIGGTHPITEYAYRGAPSSRIYLRSAIMVGDLYRHGVTANKSFTASPPEIMPDLRRHFWRGVFDGDGNISLPPDGGMGNVALRLFGLGATCEAFARWASETTEVRCGTRPHKTIFTARITGRRQVVRVVEILYGHSSISLDRKMESAKLILNAARNLRDRARVSVNAPQGSERQHAG